MVKYYRRRFRRRAFRRRRPMFKRRRVYRRKPRYSRRRFRRPPTRFKNREVRNFRYVQELTINLGEADDGDKAHIPYNLMSPIHPVAGGNHSPLGWDEWWPHYQYWRVLGAKIKVRDNGDGLNAVNETNVLIQIPRSGEMADFDHMTTVYEHFGIDNRKILRCGNAQVPARGPHKSIYKTWSARKWFGMVDKMDRQYYGNLDSGPTKEVKAYVCAYMNRAEANPGIIRLLVQIDYMVEFLGALYDADRDEPT